MWEMQKRPKLFTLFIIILVVNLVVTTTSIAKERQVKVVFDGSELSFEEPLMMIDGITYVPMRAIFEAHGAFVKWDNENKEITATRGDVNIVYPVNEAIMYLNGVEVNLGIKSIIVNNSTLVPLRFVSKALGSDVRWEKETNSVKITTVNNSVPSYSNSLPLNTTITLTSLNRTKSLMDVERKVNIIVNHYGIEENTLYSSLSFQNYSDQDIYISLAPSDKKVIRSYSKELDPMPYMNTQDCSEMTNHVTIDSVSGRIYQTPIFSVNQACVDSNKAQKDAFEKWRSENSGITIGGRNTVLTRKYVQDSEGSLQELVVPAHYRESLIIIASTGEDKNLVINGGYYSKSEKSTSVDFKLDYSIEPNLDLGTYKLFYNMDIW